MLAVTIRDSLPRAVQWLESTRETESGTQSQGHIHPHELCDLNHSLHLSEPQPPMITITLDDCVVLLHQALCCHFTSYFIVTQTLYSYFVHLTHEELERLNNSCSVTQLAEWQN
jgi:hypothetical protein